jgi:adenylate cyclase
VILESSGITALSRYSSLFVIARNSCFTYKGRAVDIKQVGRELGVRYVLEGSVRTAGNRVRITGQLIEADTAGHVWAERYDRDLTDIFAVQDEISVAVTIAIAPAIADAELQQAMRRPVGTLDAWGAYQRGLWHLGRSTKDGTLAAEQFFHQAIACDPNFAAGHRGLAWPLVLASARFQTMPQAKALALAEAAARRAVALDGNDAEARVCFGGVLPQRYCDHDGARAEAEAALAISPNLASA